MVLVIQETVSAPATRAIEGEGIEEYLSPGVDLAGWTASADSVGGACVGVPYLDTVDVMTSNEANENKIIDPSNAKGTAKDGSSKGKSTKPSKRRPAVDRAATQADVAVDPVTENSSTPAEGEAGSTAPLANYEFIAPSEVRLPLPPVPTESHEVAGWMELYRAHVELARLDVELIKLSAERAKAQNDLRKSNKDEATQIREARKAEIELQAAEISLSASRRTERNALSEDNEVMVYTFSGGVTEESVQTAIAALEVWARRSPGAPITIQLNSPGGSVFHGLALFDYFLSLRARGHELTIMVLGMAASMGSILLQAGDHRVMGPNAYVMLHEVSSWMVGKTANLEDEVEFHKRLEKRLVEILCSRSKYTPEKLLEEWKKKDLWMDADKCLSNGLVDRVGVDYHQAR